MVPTRAGQALLDRFERIRIISLPSRNDRRRDVVRQLRRLGLQIDGDRIAFHDATRPAEPGGFPTIGARGCFLSHLEVLEDALQAGARTVLIMEDDADLVRDVETHLPPMLEDLARREWSIFYGGYHWPDAPPSSTAMLLQAEPSTGLQNAHFMAFTRKGAERAVAFLRQVLTRPPGDPDGGPMHVDGAYSWLRRVHPELTTWLALPEIAFQRRSRTDIHEGALFYDRVPGLRMVAGIARKLVGRRRGG